MADVAGLYLDLKSQHPVTQDGAILSPEVHSPMLLGDQNGRSRRARHHITTASTV